MPERRVLLYDSYDDTIRRYRPLLFVARFGLAMSMMGVACLGAVVAGGVVLCALVLLGVLG